MAHRIKVISMFRPRVDQGVTVQKPALLRAMSRATSIVEGTLDQILTELHHHIVEILISGRAVKIPGLGTWTPNLALDGTLEVQYRADARLISALKDAPRFEGHISNRENIGLTGDELVAKWNQLHPEDRVME